MAAARNDSVISRARDRASLPIVLGVLGIVAGLVMAFVVPRIGGDGWAKDAKAAESVASDFLSTCYTIDPANVDATREALAPLVTDNFTTTCLDLLASTDVDKSAYAAAEVTFGDVVIGSMGTVNVDGDSADVVAAYTFVASSPQSASIAPLASRSIVHLVKEGSEWKVNDLSEIIQVDAQLTSPSESEDGGS